MKKMEAWPSTASCLTGAKKDGMGHSKTVIRRFFQWVVVAMVSLKSKAASKVGKVTATCAHWTAGVPDAGNDAVGAPGVHDLVHGIALVFDDAGLSFHGDDFDGADGAKITQAAMGNRADAAGTAAEEAADRGLDDSGGVTAELPAELAGGGFYCAEFHARLTDRDAVCGDGLDAVHALQIENDAALQWDSLAVVAGAGAAEGYGDIMLVAVAERGDNLIDGDGLDDDVGSLGVQLRLEDGGVPVEVAREALDDLWLREDTRWVGDQLCKACGQITHEDFLFVRASPPPESYAVTACVERLRWCDDCCDSIVTTLRVACRKGDRISRS
jgi:hypothetical protein